MYIVSWRWVFVGIIQIRSRGPTFGYFMLSGVLLPLQVSGPLNAGAPLNAIFSFSVVSPLLTC